MKPATLALALVAAASCGDIPGPMLGADANPSAELPETDASTNPRPRFAGFSDFEEVGCPEGYAEWKCAAATLESTEDVFAYSLAIRWSLPDAEVEASSLWVLGGQGRGKWRSEHNGKAVQDRLAQANRRSVEIEFVDDKGYVENPGLLGMGHALSAAIDALSSRQIAAAELTYIGASNGATIGAFAMAHSGLHNAVSRFIFGAGPFLADIERECSDPSFYAYIEDAGLRALVDSVDGSIDAFGARGTGCEDSSADALPPYSSRSMFGGSWRTAYPNTAVTVIMGENDQFGRWIFNSNDHWFSTISASAKTKYVFPQLEHDIFANDEVGDLVFDYANAKSGVEPHPTPRLLFSKTLNGPETTTFGISETVYGKAINIGPDSAFGCAAREENRADCVADMSRWNALGDGIWNYDTQAAVWRTTFTGEQFHTGAGRYVMVVGDSDRHSWTPVALLKGE